MKLITTFMQRRNFLAVSSLALAMKTVPEG